MTIIERSKALNKKLDFLKEHYPSNGALHCADKLRCSVSYVRSLCSKFKIKPNKERRHLIAIERHKNRKCKNFQPKYKLELPWNLKYEEFLKINTPEMAYFYGYMWADGHVKNGTLRLEILQSDLFSIWETVLKKIGMGTYTIRKRKNSSNAQARITIGNFTSGGIVDIFKYRDFENKSNKNSSPLKIINIIKPNIQHYFYRGFLDGDGSIYVSSKNAKKKQARILFNGGYNTNWDFIINLANQLNISYSIERKIRKKTKHKYSTIAFGAIASKILGNYIYNGYDNDKIGLERKYSNFIKIIEKNY